MTPCWYQAVETIPCASGRWTANLLDSRLWGTANGYLTRHSVPAAPTHRCSHPLEPIIQLSCGTCRAALRSEVRSALKMAGRRVSTSPLMAVYLHPAMQTAD